MQLQLYRIDHQTQQEAFYSSPHAHQHYELFYFTKGNATHNIDFTTYPVRDNDCFLVSRHQVHYLTAPAYSHNQGYVLSFGQSFFQLLDPSLQALFGAFTLNPAYKVLPHLEGLFVALFEQVQRELAASLPNTWELVRHLAQVLLAYLQRQQDHEQPNDLGAAGTYPTLFRRFLVRLEQHLRDKHSVQEYAELLEVSTKQLARACKYVSGKGTLSLIHERLDLEAKRLLFYSPLSVKEIAYQLGFTDPAHFSHFFKRRNDCAPEHFRERVSGIYMR